MALGDKIRQLDEQVAAVVRRAVDQALGEVRQEVEELRGRLERVSPEIPDSFLDEEQVRALAEEAAPPPPEPVDEEAIRREAAEQAREEMRAEARATGEAAGAAQVGARTDAFSALRDALASIDRARNQNGVLDALMEATTGHASRAVVLLLRPEGLVGWTARGFGAADDTVRSASVSAQAEGWGAVVQGDGARRLEPGRCAQLVSQLDSALPAEGVALPVVLRDRVSAVVYADRTQDGGSLDVEALQVLTYTAALALETLAFRDRAATATLAPVAAAGAAGEAAVEAEQPEVLPAEEPEALPSAEQTALPAETEAPVEEVEVAEERPEPVEELPELEEEIVLDEEAPEERPPSRPHGDELLSPVEEEPAPTFESEQTFEAERAEEPELETDFEVDLDGAPELEEAGAPPEAEESAEPVAWTTDEAAAPEPEPEVEAEPPPIEAVPDLETEPEAEDQREGLAEPEEEVADRPEAGAVPEAPPQPAEAGAAPPPEERDPREATGGAVQPPSDVQGPGSAFADKEEAASPDEEAAHDEARRLARLLVSEIQLYNQEKVEEGRRNNDVYERLKDDIDRSRQLYEERVAPELRDSTDYFYQELVRQLGAGDAKSLGI